MISENAGPGHAGNLGFRNIDRQDRCAELRTCAGEPFAAGSGFRAAAVNEAVGIGFEQMALVEIYADVNPGDTAQLRILEEAGFHHDVEQREQQDLVRMVLSEPDWKAARGLGPRVVLMQPQFLPWLGYLELIHRADVFVFLDDFQFLRRSWGHRNRLFVVKGKEGMITLPVRHECNQEATFLDLAEAETTIWRRKFLNLLNQNYRNAPYGVAVLALVTEWLARAYPSIAELEIALVERIAAYLDLRPRFVRSSSLNVTGLRRSWRLKALLEKLGAGTYVSAHGSFPYMKEDEVFPLAELPTYFQDHIPRAYKQHGSDAFVPRLSCLDALANLGPAEVRTTLQGTDWWQNWGERSAAEETLLRQDLTSQET